MLLEKNNVSRIRKPCCSALNASQSPSNVKEGRTIERFCSSLAALPQPVSITAIALSRLRLICSVSIPHSLLLVLGLLSCFHLGHSFPNSQNMMSSFVVTKKIMHSSGMKIFKSSSLSTFVSRGWGRGHNAQVHHLAFASLTSKPLGQSTYKNSKREHKLFMSSSLSTSTSTTIDENDNMDALSQTPLGMESASHLLDGLDVYTVYSNDEQKHPISVYGIHSKNQSEEFKNDGIQRRPILLLHGRTWSSVPVYHLLGGNQSSSGQSEGKSRSLMESLYAQGLQPYAMDFRGFGGTPSDETNSVTPNTCVCDVGYALDFITKKHAQTNAGNNGDNYCHLPALLGWSQGALVAQLFAQKSPQLISKLILYGSIYDPLLSYPPMPLYVNGTDTSNEERIKNTFNAAIEDFTIEGSIPPEPATKFAEAALQSDPYKAKWTYLSQFNNVDPARISVPTLVVAGDQDPYAPMRVQVSLFENLGRGADRTWSIIADADHAVHLLDDGRDRFINIVTSFVENGKKGETYD